MFLRERKRHRLLLYFGLMQLLGVSVDGNECRRKIKLINGRKKCVLLVPAPRLPAANRDENGNTFQTYRLMIERTNVSCDDNSE